MKTMDSVDENVLEKLKVVSVLVDILLHPGSIS